MSTKRFVICTLHLEHGRTSSTDALARLREVFGGLLREHRAGPYWRTDDVTELVVVLGVNKEDPEEALRLAMERLGQGWHIESEGETAFAVWNPVGGASLTIAGVRFAHACVSDVAPELR